MPMLLEHIDAIARRLQRDVLMLTCRRDNEGVFADHRSHPQAVAILAWLDREAKGWKPCSDFASDHVMRSYAGEVFVSAPFDESDSQYQKVQRHLEHPDGAMRFSHVNVYPMMAHHAASRPLLHEKARDCTPPDRRRTIGIREIPGRIFQRLFYLCQRQTWRRNFHSPLALGVSVLVAC